MTEPVTVAMPLELSRDMLNAVFNDPLTSIEDKEERYTRMGWLICAWEVLIRHRTTPIACQGQQP
jgi:hypothetical protein